MKLHAERSIIVMDDEERSRLDVIVAGDKVKLINHRGIEVSGKILQIYGERLLIKTEHHTEYNVSFKRIEHIKRIKHGR